MHPPIRAQEKRASLLGSRTLKAVPKTTTPEMTPQALRCSRDSRLQAPNDMMFSFRLLLNTSRLDRYFVVKAPCSSMSKSFVDIWSFSVLVALSFVVVVFFDRRTFVVIITWWCGNGGNGKSGASVKKFENFRKHTRAIHRISRIGKLGRIVCCHSRDRTHRMDGVGGGTTI